MDGDTPRIVLALPIPLMGTAEERDTAEKKAFPISAKARVQPLTERRPDFGKGARIPKLTRGIGTREQQLASRCCVELVRAVGC